MLYQSKVRWDAEHTKVVTMKLNTNTDADILARLDIEADHTETGGKQGYIKRLIRADIEKKNKQ